MRGCPIRIRGHPESLKAATPLEGEKNDLVFDLTYVYVIFNSFLVSLLGFPLFYFTT